MAEYTAAISWARQAGEAFVDQRYSRRHTLRFDGGAQLQGSSSPLSVALPMSDPSAVDPEEMFVASISSCHMLWFLALAAKRGLCVERYDDAAVGVMAKNAEGRLAITRVTLRPTVVFAAGHAVAPAELQGLHHAAHEACYIANSVKGEVVCEPVFAAA